MVARHLNDCSSCAELTRQHRFLTKALRFLGTNTDPDPIGLVRLNTLLVAAEAKS
jgi:hypothetical protein